MRAKSAWAASHGPRTGQLKDLPAWPAHENRHRRLLKRRHLLYPRAGAEAEAVQAQPGAPGHHIGAAPAGGAGAGAGAGASGGAAGAGAGGGGGAQHHGAGHGARGRRGGAAGGGRGGRGGLSPQALPARGPRSACVAGRVYSSAQLGRLAGTDLL